MRLHTALTSARACPNDLCLAGPDTQAVAAPEACICAQQHVHGATTGSGIELPSPPHRHAGPYLRRQRSLCSQRCERWPHSCACRPVPLQNRPRGRRSSCKSGLKALPTFSRCHYPPPVHSRRLLLCLHLDEFAFRRSTMLEQCTLQFLHECQSAATRMSRLTLAAPAFVRLQSSRTRRAIVDVAEVCGVRCSRYDRVSALAHGGGSSCGIDGCQGSII